MTTILPTDNIPDSVMAHLFDFLKPNEKIQALQVNQRWKKILLEGNNKVLFKTLQFLINNLNPRYYSPQKRKLEALKEKELVKLMPLERERLIDILAECCSGDLEQLPQPERIPIGWQKIMQAAQTRFVGEIQVRLQPVRFSPELIERTALPINPEEAYISVRMRSIRDPRAVKFWDLIRDDLDVYKYADARLRNDLDPVFIPHKYIPQSVFDNIHLKGSILRLSCQDRTYKLSVALYMDQGKDPEPEGTLSFSEDVKVLSSGDLNQIDDRTILTSQELEEPFPL